MLLMKRMYFVSDSILTVAELSVSWYNWNACLMQSGPRLSVMIRRMDSRIATECIHKKKAMKSRMITEDFNDALTYAMHDLASRWKDYRKRYLKWKEQK